MSASADIWRLPGPGSYVAELARTVVGGRHVAAILPQYLATDVDRAGTLASALVDELPNAVRVHPYGGDGPLVEALGRDLTYSDEHPVTVPELLGHEDLHEKVIVCVQSDLDDEHQGELPEFLRRLQTDSRSIETSQRCTFVVITDRSGLPSFAGNEHADVTLANSWYWHRVSRWDVAAHMAITSAGPTGPELGVLHEVRTETIIEVARWDLDLAAHLSVSWSGQVSELSGLCQRPQQDIDTLSAAGRVGARPPEALLEAWESGLVEGWHESVCIAPTHRLERTSELNRLLWSAQARVLLPWIEINRHRLEEAVLKALGRELFHRALTQHATVGFNPSRSEDVAEIGLLHSVIFSYLRSDARMSTAARALRDARNKLAHLTPLAQGQLDQLVRACAFLQG